MPGAGMLTEPKPGLSRGGPYSPAPGPVFRVAHGAEQDQLSHTGVGRDDAAPCQPAVRL